MIALLAYTYCIAYILASTTMITLWGVTGNRGLHPGGWKGKAMAWTFIAALLITIFDYLKIKF